jgi:hypothetical protein
LGQRLNLLRRPDDMWCLTSSPISTVGGVLGWCRISRIRRRGRVHCRIRVWCRIGVRWWISVRCRWLVSVRCCCVRCWRILICRWIEPRLPAESSASAPAPAIAESSASAPAPAIAESSAKPRNRVHISGNRIACAISSGSTCHWS